jgi:hypothetical protein
MSLIFNKYLSLDLPSSFMVQAVMSAMSKDACLISDKKSIKNIKYIDILNSFSFKERWIIDRPTLFLARKRVTKYVLFFTDLDRKAVVKVFNQIFKRVLKSQSSEAVLIHMFVPFGATFDVIDFLDLLNPTNLVLIENSKITHISFVLKGN